MKGNLGTTARRVLRCVPEATSGETISPAEVARRLDLGGAVVDQVLARAARRGAVVRARVGAYHLAPGFRLPPATRPAWSSKVLQRLASHAAVASKRAPGHIGRPPKPVVPQLTEVRSLLETQPTSWVEYGGGLSLRALAELSGISRTRLMVVLKAGERLGCLQRFHVGGSVGQLVRVAGGVR